MKVKSSIESFNDTNKIPETFSFSEKENEKQILNKDFVFKFEDNTKQLGTDANNASTGEEENSDNHVEEHLEKKRSEQEHKEEEKIREQVSETSTTTATTTSATAASSATATVSTIAATTTAAVVLVVGGGLALGQTVDKPNICEFNQVVAVENNINFTLSLGNDQLKIDNGEENTECDILVEISCPSISDFHDEISVKQFGKVEGEFKNLEYDTEYLLNVSQHVMLGADSDYLLDTPYSITTPKKVQPIVDGLSITKGYNPLGDSVYFAQFTYTKEIPEYEYSYIGLVDAELFDGSENVDWINFADFNPRSGEKQKLNFNSDVYPGDMVAAILLEGKKPESEQGEYARWILYYVELDFGNLDETEGLINDEDFYFKRHTTNGQLDSFDAYVSYSGDVSQYDYFTLSAYYNDESAGADGLEVFNSRLTSGLNSINSGITVSPDYESYTWGTLTVKLFGYVAGATAEEVILAREIDFSRVPTEDIYVPTHPTYNSTTFIPYVSQSASHHYAILDISYDDPDQVWSKYFRLELTPNDAQGESYTFEVKPCPFYGLTDYCYISELTEEEFYAISSLDAYKYTLTAIYSSHPDDSGAEYVCIIDEPLSGLDDNAQYVPVGVTTEYDSSTMTAMFVLQRFEGSENFNSFNVTLTRTSDPDTTQTISNVEIGVETNTDMPVQLEDQSYHVEIYGVTEGEATLLFEETIDYFGVS